MAGLLDLQIDCVQSTFAVAANASAATATATKAAVANRCHVVTKGIISLSASGTATWTLTFGTTTVATGDFTGTQFVLDFGNPGLMNTTANSLVSLALSSAGGAIVGKVNLIGFTTAAPS